MITLSEPRWPHCGRLDYTTDLSICAGIPVPGHTACLAHLSRGDRDRYLAALGPGDNVDHRGTPFTETLLSALIDAVRDPGSGRPHFGSVDLRRAQFVDDAEFTECHISGRADFYSARFAGEAFFHGTRFSGETWFGDATFSGTASFIDATFTGEADFHGARFTDGVFYRARFAQGAGFSTASFSGSADFIEAQFETAAEFGPLTCAQTVDLSGALFKAPMTMEIAAQTLNCERTRWEATATLRLRYAIVNLGNAVLSGPTAIMAHPAPFSWGRATVDESALAGQWNGVAVYSVQGVDAAHLVLTDTNLSACLFAGAFHLDQLRLEGRCAFATTPAGIHVRNGLWPYRWTRRRTLAEEHHWRAQAAGQPTPLLDRASLRFWDTGPHHPDPELTPDPEDVAATYRQLRKAFEDAKNEPGAADFYYGEMEMRRHDRAGTPRSERGLLWCYWLLSGYGLRATRALVWLLGAMAATVVLILGLGLPDSPPQQVATGTFPANASGRVTLTVDTEDARLTLPIGDRFTTGRFDKALRVVLNSVVFRSSGQDLTTWGTYTEMVSRFTEPVLLALAALAMRNRIKR